MIYISTGGFNNVEAWKTSKLLYDNGIDNIELSGGIYDPLQSEYLVKLSKNISFQVHNYFPPPIHPFVFNLGSLDKDICKLSFQHALRAIKLSSDLGGKYFSFHAGFLLDPNVKDLGKRIKKSNLFSRKESLSLFIENVIKLSDFSKGFGIDLLVENNVISLNNFNEFKSNPFLMTDPDECNYVMSQLPTSVNLLVDVAHLKVSANSLNFNPVRLLDLCNNRIKAYHLSDNDGKSDTNMAISEKSWFWNHIDLNLDYYTIEVYNSNPKVLVQQLKLANKIINND